ncbi:PILR alpha-associated neural protein [Discoglossus pictus]
MLTAQIQNLSPGGTSFPPRYTQHRHNHLGAKRSKRQSSSPQQLFPAVPKGVAPPSQYPWAIVWDPTVSDEDWGILGSDSSTLRPSFHLEKEEPARGLDLRGVPTTLRPPYYPPEEKGTDPQLYVTTVISVIIVLTATGIVIKFW